MSALISCVFVATYLNKYLFYCEVVYTESCTLYIDAVHFFQILIFCPFSTYYYMTSLSDFRPNFLYEFKLNQSAAESARKIIQVLAMIVLMNALFDVGLRNFIPEILATKMSPEVVDLQ